MSSTHCTKLAKNSNACDLGLYDCKHIAGVCEYIDPSYRCQCCTGFTHKDGVCVGMNIYYTFRVLLLLENKQVTV